MIRLPRIQSKNDVNLLQSGGEARQLPCVRSSEKVIPAGASEKQKLGFSIGPGAWVGVYMCYCVFVCVSCVCCVFLWCVCCVCIAVCVCCWCGCFVFVCVFLLRVCVLCVCMCVLFCAVLFFWGVQPVAEWVWQSRGPAGAKQIGSTAESFSSRGQETLGLGRPWWRSG